MGGLTGDFVPAFGLLLMGGALLPKITKMGSVPVTAWMRTGVVIIGIVVVGANASSNRKQAVDNAPAVQPPTTSETSLASSSSLTTVKGFPVVRVADGDTFTVTVAGKEEKVRIIGIDAPEKSPTECYAKESSAKLIALIGGKDVALESEPTDDRDNFGRLLRYVSLDGQDVGAVMIREGYAVSYRKYPHPRIESYNVMEVEAKDRNVGLWSSCTNPKTMTSSKASVVPPPSSQTASVPSTTTSVQQTPTQTSPSAAGNGECVIKGNVNSKGDRIYHLPGCGSYKQTQIRPAEGDRWFCTEQEAQVAGFRRAGNCN